MGQGRQEVEALGRRSTVARGGLPAGLDGEQSSSVHSLGRAQCKGRARAAERGINEMHRGGTNGETDDGTVRSVFNAGEKGAFKEKDGGRPALQGIQNAAHRV